MDLSSDLRMSCYRLSRLPFGVAALTVLMASHVAAQTSVTHAATPPGCYDVEIGSWSPPMAIGPDTVYTMVPSRIHLDTAVTKFGTFAIVPAPGIPPTVHRFAGWRVVDTGRVMLTWSNGLSGLRAVVSFTGRDSLVGEARTFWDFGRPEQTAPLALVRMRGGC